MHVVSAGEARISEEFGRIAIYFCHILQNAKVVTLGSAFMRTGQKALTLWRKETEKKADAISKSPPGSIVTAETQAQVSLGMRAGWTLTQSSYYFASVAMILTHYSTLQGPMLKSCSDSGCDFSCLVRYPLEIKCR